MRQGEQREVDEKTSQKGGVWAMEGETQRRGKQLGLWKVIGEWMKGICREWEEEREMARKREKIHEKGYG